MLRVCMCGGVCCSHAAVAAAVPARGRGPVGPWAKARPIFSQLD